MFIKNENKCQVSGVGINWHGWLFRNTHFKHHLELEADDSSRFPVVQAFNNSINIFLISVYFVFFPYIFMNIENIISINTIIIKWKIIDLSV